MKKKILASFDQFIAQAETRLAEAIRDEDWGRAGQLDAWLDGLRQGRIIVELAKENDA